MQKASEKLDEDKLEVSEELALSLEKVLDAEELLEIRECNIIC
jgi:hypothetical protein